MIFFVFRSFPDKFVRTYAVNRLSNVSSDELKDILPQLIQVKLINYSNVFQYIKNNFIGCEIRNES